MKLIMMKLMKSSKCGILLLLAALMMTACAAPQPPAPSEEAAGGTEPLVLAVTEKPLWLSLAVEEYNAAEPERQIELAVYESSSHLLAGLERGEACDMYFVELADSAYGLTTSGLWERSADLSERLDSTGTKLAYGLREALEYEGELRLLPFDFTLFSFAAQLDSMPASVQEAQQLAASRGATLFPETRDRANLAVLLEPFLLESAAEGDTAQLQALAAAVEEHQGSMTAPAGGTEYLFEICFLRDYFNFGLDVYERDYEDTGREFVVGIPGTDTAAFYTPGHVFGIIESCSEPDAAWDFLKLLCSDETQALADEFPASQTAFDEYIAEKLNGRTVTEHAAELLTAVLENTTAASPGMKLHVEHYDEDTFRILRDIAQDT